MDTIPPSNSNMLHYGFSSIDEEIAKDQLDAENAFRNSSQGLDSVHSNDASVLQNIAPSMILDVSQAGSHTKYALAAVSSIEKNEQSTTQLTPAALDGQQSAEITQKLKPGWPRGKKRKTGKLKDENAPKAPLTGYVMFMNERRDTIKAENPNITFPELTKAIAAEWSSLEPRMKQRYLENAEKNKEKYMEELAAYQQTEAFKAFQKKKQKGSETKITEETGKDRPRLPGLEVPIFTEEFMVHNKTRETELRDLRKLNVQFEEQNAILSQHVDEIKTVVAHLEEEATVQRNNNLALLQHLDSLRIMLASSFVHVPLPGTNEVPTVATIDNYMSKLHQIILESPQEHEDLIVTVREIINKLNLESYIT